MRKNQQRLKLFLAIFVSTAIIFSSAYVGPQAFEKGTKPNDIRSAQPKNKPVKDAEKPKKETDSPTKANETIINEASVKMGQIPEELQTFLFNNTMIDIPAKSTFSLLEFAKQEKLEKIGSETLSGLATAIYEAILPSDFTILERNIGSQLPIYAPLGFEAKVNLEKNVDLVFLNPTKSSYVLELQFVNNSLLVTLKGEKFPYDYKINTKDVQSLKPKTIIQYSPLLLLGQSKVTNEGLDGQVVTVSKDVYQGDQLIRSDFVSNDYYPPVYRVEVHPLGGTIDQQRITSISSAQTNYQTDQQMNNGQTTTAANATVQNANSSDLYGKSNEAAK